MRIGLITSEFSGLPGSGGIGTYFLELARCLVSRGHEVEVFTIGDPGSLQHEPGILFHHLGNLPNGHFPVHAAEAFAARHREIPFDLLESAELKAEGCLAARAVPEVANVVRMHSPSKLLNRHLDLTPTFTQRTRHILKSLRIALGAWRRDLPILPLQLDTNVSPWFPNNDVEERHAAAGADLVIVMSGEMRDFVKGYWWIKEEAITEVPNPLRLQISDSTERNEGLAHAPTIGFLGRLEPRKGLVELARALALVLPEFPEWRVEIAGRSVTSCLSGADVGEMARQILKPFADRVAFVGPVLPRYVPAWFSKIDICVFPSLWDNFPYVVLEAMAAGKAIIATKVGAVPQMLNRGKAGEIIPPGNILDLATALRKLMKDSVLRTRLGKAAQEHVATKYHHELVTSQILEAYQFAIRRRDQRTSSKVGSN